MVHPIAPDYDEDAYIEGSEVFMPAAMLVQVADDPSIKPWSRPTGYFTLHIPSLEKRGNPTLRAMVDTGSELNLISSSLAQELVKAGEVVDTAGQEWRVEGINGGSDQLVGTINNLQAIIGGRQVRFTVFYGKFEFGNQYDMILGQPFLFTTGATMAYNTDILEPIMTMRLQPRDTDHAIEVQLSMTRKVFRQGNTIRVCTAEAVYFPFPHAQTARRTGKPNITTFMRQIGAQWPVLHRGPAPMCRECLGYLRTIGTG